MRVVITGGGTGGHLSVARTFLYAFIARGYVCVFIGSSSGADKMYFENETHLNKKWFLETSGVVNKRGIGFLKALWKQGCALKEACRILKEFKPDFVLSVGGYSAAPAAFGACLLRIPLIIHEQNAEIGRLNKILKPFAKVFFSSYLESSPIKFYPIMEVFFKKARVRNAIKNVLFMGGSQGARAINAFAIGVAEELKRRGIRVFHQSGKADFVRVVEEYINEGLSVGVLDKTELESEMQQKVHCVELDSINSVDVVVFSFCKEMPSVYALCDFAVCRAGASSLWELCANGLPALFVPYPYAARNHQYYNAKFIEEKGLGFLCLEQNLFCEVLWECLELLEDKIAQVSTDLQKECAMDATKQMCATIERTISTKA
ncbi:UDP-N-acetylglucosamine--N-acetylmuramyl-(pentapeptide) pyrophosphoryl-undecaprenol N-acetylglucosamine transferase [Helicobacter turcicus]|uniref:UDP-N-acetylglucosamine--N-acetylmuramyl-(pentapeptide) pyrophosphoryl-undecaprenol N-acetylglucosamine transferase n=1 Tax=Helicobacter turcicus TaxID=2867412 RepID=A0ABS7JLJ5_9HELI|nr:UDP-N-acetylglucosamine--N-acetylmuramyl-(pentapeptide) pyrophosphoryl-undecaprenol N-acetylglucosamine transferase [Helicobacter turcicus]MBX7490274.1 UDP-N-acetylglucosamine--N-acetylmuramyl-(pentapeptide) pyrophosphoryl-undecaprenol N-acetylglucosamine transferase [Helicobacter turcicus]MBX7545147.1 UDP-N-acetylglucosamine--N-acetylmuramyl-(pentapeptide) pyrophosphoryl-undecaprenol N-acetylglucosamine transferase [Helicobacter turcicus]